MIVFSLIEKEIKWLKIRVNYPYLKEGVCRVTYKARVD